MSIQMCIQGSFVNAVFLTLIFSMFRTLFFISKGMVRYFFFFKNKCRSRGFSNFGISHSEFSRDFKIQIPIPGTSRSGFFLVFLGFEIPKKSHFEANSSIEILIKSCYLSFYMPSFLQNTLVFYILSVWCQELLLIIWVSFLYTYLFNYLL